MEKDIKQSKITITKNLYDSRKLLENYYSQKTKELTKDLPIEETKKIQNLLISLKSRIDLKSYIEFMKDLVPKEHHEKVFYSNAKELFKL